MVRENFLYSCHSGDLEGVKRFIDDTYISVDHLKYGIQHAAISKQVEVFSYIFEEKGFFTQDILADTLFRLSKNGCVKGIQKLLSYAFFKYKHYLDDAIDYAVEGDQIDAVRFYIESGYLVDDRNDMLLLSASTKGFLTLSKYLLSIGASFSCLGTRHLVHIINRGEVDLVALLLEFNAFNHQNDDGTPFLAACNKGYHEIALLLADSGQVKYRGIGMKTLLKNGDFELLFDLAVRGGTLTHCNHNIDMLHIGMERYHRKSNLTDTSPRILFLKLKPEHSGVLSLFFSAMVQHEDISLYDAICEVSTPLKPYLLPLIANEL